LTVRQIIRWRVLRTPSPTQFGRSTGGRSPLWHRLRLLIASAVSRLRGRHLLVLDTAGIVVAATVALIVRYGDVQGVEAHIPHVVPIIGLLLAIRTVIDMRSGLYGHDWRFASVPDLQRIVGAVALGSLVTFVVVWALTIASPGTIAGPGTIASPGFNSGLPLSFWPIELLMTLFVVGGMRFGIRAVFDLAPDSREEIPIEYRATLLYGAGRVGVMMARSAQRTPSAGVAPVGFLDDNPKLAGTMIAGLPVFGGLNALERAATQTGARALLITMSNTRGSVVRQVVEAASKLRLDVRTVPSMVELLDGTVDAYRVRRVRVEDLLRRPIATERSATVREVFHDRTVLITGAGGSIGSELARQVFAMGPRRLILLDRAESALFDVHRLLEELRGDGSVELQPYLANIVSRTAMSRLIGSEKPDVILHAAAYKHVPMMEQHPSEAVQVNIAGTLAVLDAAVEAGVERFVLVSTDKAVRPSSVMGASKRVAELLVADAARGTGRSYVSVRFGNVLGSNGSVVPIFQEQLDNGRPLTITDPEMTRFFMTIPEASWLILDAAAMGRQGDLFVLDMGEPIKIMDLARDVARLAGRDPDSQPIEFIGLRPGEKLHEELFYDAERVEPTSTPKVLRAVSDAPPPGVRESVGRLLEFATGEHDDELRSFLFACARGPDAPRTRDGRRLGAIHVVVEGKPLEALTPERAGASLSAGSRSQGGA